MVASLTINPKTVLKANREPEINVLTGRPGQGTFIETTLTQVALPELTGLRRSLLARLTTAETAGLDEDGMVAIFATMLRDFRERPSNSGGRREPASDETEGVA